MNEINPANQIQLLLTELLGLVEISNVFLLKMDFALMPECQIPQPYSMVIGRAPINLTVRDKEVVVVVGFEINGTANDKPLFTGHFDFQISFKHDNHIRINEIFQNEDLQNIFAGPQADKIVWSYFRKAVQQILLDAGLQTALIPLYR